MELAHDITHLPIRHLLSRSVRARLVRVGPAGGPGWNPMLQAQLFESLEWNWPTGQLLVWLPHPGGVWYLLDGHRRLDALLRAVDEHTLLVRDLGADKPTYLPTRRAGGGPYLPVATMLATLPFLTFTRQQPPPVPPQTADRAHRAATALLSSNLQVLRLLGGTPAQVHTLAGRLIPGRVRAETLNRITAAPTT